MSTAAMLVQKENIPTNKPYGKALSSGELKMMLGQCLKMASENKITTNNTWGLPLIEHLDDLIREEDPTQHTNFQRASVTLDAGVKIYSYRVDSVHTETFKMLGGLGRASGPAEEGGEGTSRSHFLIIMIMNVSASIPTYKGSALTAIIFVSSCHFISTSR
jgi:hypothetical protein